MGPSESKATDLIECLTVSPMPRDVAIIAELNISPITIKILWPFLLGIFRVPIFTKINLLVAETAITININSKSTAIVIANPVAGSPKTFSIIRLLHHLSFE